MIKFSLSLTLLMAGNSCIAMHHQTDAKKRLSNALITVPSKEVIIEKLGKIGLGLFAKNIAEKTTTLAGEKLPPITIVGHVNGWLKEDNYNNDSSLQPKIVKILINNESIYNQLAEMNWLNLDSSNI
jgi:hypothetical protein